MASALSQATFRLGGEGAGFGIINTNDAGFLAWLIALGGRVLGRSFAVLC
jgi:hypothetical protein